jgi:hypothetical protein
LILTVVVKVGWQRVLACSESCLETAYIHLDRPFQARAVVKTGGAYLFYNLLNLADLY